MLALVSTEGRIGRCEYFIVIIVSNLIHAYLETVAQGMGHQSNGTAMLFIGATVALVIVNICAIVKRFHDINRSGMHLFFLSVPLYNIYLSLLLLFQGRVTGSNRFAPYKPLDLEPSRGLPRAERPIRPSMVRTLNRQRRGGLRGVTVTPSRPRAA